MGNETATQEGHELGRKIGGICFTVHELNECVGGVERKPSSAGLQEFCQALLFCLGGPQITGVGNEKPGRFNAVDVTEAISYSRVDVLVFGQ